MKKLLLFCLLLANDTSFAFNFSHLIKPSPKRITDFLNNPRQENLLIQAQDNKQIHELIQKRLYQLMTSSIGLQLSIAVLHCDAELIERHIGLDKPQSEDLAKLCLQFPPQLDFSRYFAKSPKDELRKTTLDKGFEKRTYSLLFTKDNNYAFDSWTTPTTNRTTLVMPATEDPFNELHMLWVLAHEIAIYFDTKFWSSAPDTLKDKKLRKSDKVQPKERFNSLPFALDNPLIANVFAFMRAFKVESLFLSSLGFPEQKEILDLIDQFSQQNVVDILEEQSSRLVPIALPLISFAPHYRSLLWSHRKKYSEARGFTQLEFSRNVRNLIMDLPGYFFSKHMKDNFVGLISDFEWKAKVDPYLIEDFDQFMIEILQRDLRFLKSQPDDILREKLEPLLGGMNIRLSAGPRPRIVIGGTGGK